MVASDAMETMAARGSGTEPEHLQQRQVLVDGGRTCCAGGHRLLRFSEAERVCARARTRAKPKVAAVMAYDSRSSFRSDEAFSAWWIYAENGFLNVCATAGAVFLRGLRMNLGLPASTVWDESVQDALIARVDQFIRIQPEWQSIRGILIEDARAQRVTRLSVRFAIFVLYYAPSGLRADAIQLPADAELPFWGIPVPELSQAETRLYGGEPGLVCFIPGRDTPPQLLTRIMLENAARESVSGIRVGTGRETPRGTITTPPRGGMGATAGVLATLGVALLVGMVVVSRSDERKRSHGRR